ncbi:hypothetical protein MLD59_10405 [Verrucomicrobiaceae bacterium E54]|nr:hypothetical protein [Verrucomicrobiaceae bacterium E54]
MVMVLSIFMLLIGGGVAALYFNRDEARLNDGMGEIEVMAKRARMLASLQQKPYALEFTRQGVALMPYGEATLEPREREALIGEEMIALKQSEGTISPNKRESWALDAEMQLLVRRWSVGEWELLKRSDRHVWRFDPQGICEPFGVRIEMENGSWIAALFHPLTAGITEVESEIQ